MRIKVSRWVSLGEAITLGEGGIFSPGIYNTFIFTGGCNVAPAPPTLTLIIGSG